MNRNCAALASLLLAASLSAAPPAPDDQLKACREAISRFAGALMEELGKAMEAGGPGRAVRVCQMEAPAVAERVSAETGLTLRRTALKVRNPENGPDAWERAALEGFEARRAKGEALETMEASEVVIRGDRKVLRYMKAIPVKPMCLACHGSDVEPDLLASIREAYPSDAAVGFSAGDLRGAFSVTKDLGPSRP